MERKSFIVCTALIFAVISFAANAANGILLSDTGQTTCYDVVGGVIPCPAPGTSLYGQDANYSGQQQVFQDNSNGTVTDLNTALMWQKSSDGTTRNWQAAIDYCNGLDYGGHNDWRLPEQFELESIIDNGRSNQAINPVFLCQSSFYWSANTFANNADGAWGVDFYYGNGLATYKTNARYVRCVRAEL